MKLYKAILMTTAFLGASAAMVSCNEEEALNKTFDNQVYMQLPKKVETIKVKTTTTSAVKTITSRVAQPAASDIKLTYAVDKSLLAEYNAIYGQKAILLDEAYYEIPETQAMIKAGTTDSESITINFKNVNELGRDDLYLLPVTIKDATNIEVLDSERTVYYIVKGVPTISTVGNLNENYCHVEWNKRDVCNNLSTFTLETLIYGNTFIDRHMSSIMGIEAYFLVRAGDAGLQANQLQVSTGSGNITTQFFFNPKQWYHVAVTYDHGDIKVYVDGNEVASGHKDMSDYKGHGVGGVHFAWEDEVNFYHKKTGFYIGYACDAGRFLDGYFSETRIWNVVRTPDELTAGQWEVDPKSPGLVSYWKFDEGEGSVVKDHTGNGNSAVASTPIKWVPVALPAQEEAGETPSETTE